MAVKSCATASPINVSFIFKIYLLRYKTLPGFHKRKNTHLFWPSCAINWGQKEVILNHVSCFQLAPMGLADLMTQGESKLPVPLKPDGKEEGPSQTESKKVLPSLACILGLAQQNSVALSFVLWFELAPSVLSCMFFFPFMCNLLFDFYFFPYLDLKVTSSYGITLGGGEIKFNKIFRGCVCFSLIPEWEKVDLTLALVLGSHLSSVFRYSFPFWPFQQPQHSLILCFISLFDKNKVTSFLYFIFFFFPPFFLSLSLYLMRGNPCLMLHLAWRKHGGIAA